MDRDSAPIAALTADSMTAVPSGEITPVPLTGYDLDPISRLRGGDSVGHQHISSASELDCDNDAVQGSRAPAAFIDGVPVTVSVQDVDGQQRLVCVTTDPNGETVSYVGHLTAETSLQFQAQVSPQPLLADDETPPLTSAVGLLPIEPLPPVLQPLDPLDQLEALDFGREQESQEPDTEEPKKRKGGWPKGKKRKPQKESTAPRAPTTGYVIFVNERKVRLKAENPELPFTEITKMLGVQWSQLSAEDKQKYIDTANMDKQRYIRELSAYQNTEAYQAFLRRKALSRPNNLCGAECDDTDLEMEALALSQVDGDEKNDLYCRTCNQYFSSLHNKKEHLLGKQHLQMLTEEFEKETGSLRKASEPDGEPEEEEEDKEEDTELARLCGLSSLELSVLEELLMRQISLREMELFELKTSLDQVRNQQNLLNQELQKLEVKKGNLEQELQSLRDSGVTLESQLRGLKMVPLMFHLDVLERDLLPKQSISIDGLMK